MGKGDGTFQTGYSADQKVALGVFPNGSPTPDIIYADQALDRVVVDYASGQTTTSSDRSGGLLAPGAVVLADLNNKGILDLIVANGSGNNLLVYPGLGNGQFGPELNGGKGFLTGTDPVSVTVADVNGDSRPDLIVSDDGSNHLTVLLNQPDGRRRLHLRARRTAPGRPGTDVYCRPVCGRHPQHPCQQCRLEPGYAPARRGQRLLHRLGAAGQNVPTPRGKQSRPDRARYLRAQHGCAILTVNSRVEQRHGDLQRQRLDRVAPFERSVASPGRHAADRGGADTPSNAPLAGFFENQPGLNTSFLPVAPSLGQGLFTKLNSDEWGNDQAMVIYGEASVAQGGSSWLRYVVGTDEILDQIREENQPEEFAADRPGAVDEAVLGRRRRTPQLCVSSLAESS